MMQPRDAHCDDVVSDCALDEEVETLPLAVMTSSSSNQHPGEVLVGARKRKALRTVKHQVSFPVSFPTFFDSSSSQPFHPSHSTESGESRDGHCQARRQHFDGHGGLV